VCGERLVKEVTRIVAGERPASAIGAAQSRREPDDQQPRIERPERMHRRVEPVRLAVAPVVAERDEARAERAIARGLAIFWIAHDLVRRPVIHFGGSCAPPLVPALVFFKILIRGAGALRGDRALQELRVLAAFATALAAVA